MAALSSCLAASTSGALPLSAPGSDTASDDTTNTSGIRRRSRVMGLGLGQRIDGKFSVAAADLLDRIVHLVHDRHQKVGLRRLVRELQMAAAFGLSATAADQHLGQIVAGMP